MCYKNLLRMYILCMVVVVAALLLSVMHVKNPDAQSGKWPQKSELYSLCRPLSSRPANLVFGRNFHWKPWCQGLYFSMFFKAIQSKEKLFQCWNGFYLCRPSGGQRSLKLGVYWNRQECESVSKHAGVWLLISVNKRQSHHFKWQLSVCHGCLITR